jgi:hypothetical protein
VAGKISRPFRGRNGRRKNCKKLPRSGSDPGTFVVPSRRPTDWAALAVEIHGESTGISAVMTRRPASARKFKSGGPLWRASEIRSTREAALIRGPVAGGPNFTGGLQKLSLVDGPRHFGRIRREIGAGAEIREFESRRNPRKSFWRIGCGFSTQRPMAIPDRLDGADVLCCHFFEFRHQPREKVDSPKKKRGIFSAADCGRREPLANKSLPLLATKRGRRIGKSGRKFWPTIRPDGRPISSPSVETTPNFYEPKSCVGRFADDLELGLFSENGRCESYRRNAIFETAVTSRARPSTADGSVRARRKWARAATKLVD